jgi:hypothetical protein
VQEKQTALLRFTALLQVLGDVDAVGFRLAGRAGVVVAGRDEPLGDLVLEVVVEGGTLEVAHVGRDVLQLVRQDPRDLHPDVWDVADQEAEPAVTGKREQRSLPEERERLRIRLDPQRGDVRLARYVAARPLHAILHHHVKETSDRSAKPESMRRLAAFFGRNVRELDGLRRGQNLVADLRLVAPVVRVPVVARLLGTPERQQTDVDIAVEGAFGHRRRASQQQDLFRLVAGVVDDGHVGVREAQTRPSRDRHHRFEPVLGLVAAPSGPDATFHPHRHRRVVARHWQCRRMDVGLQPELVVRHCEVTAVGGQSEVFRVLRQQKRNPRLELLLVHRVAEPDRRHHLLQLRVSGILVELAFGNPGRKRLTFELELVLFQHRLLSQHPLARQRD